MRILLLVLLCAVASLGGASAAANAPFTVPSGFSIAVLSNVPAARDMAVAPNGDLFVGTMGSSVFIIPHADGEPADPHVFATLPDRPAHSVAFGDGAMYVGTQFGVWKIPYKTGDQKATGAPRKIASVRTNGVSSDHVTTSVAFLDGVLYASVGSSCNACDPDIDPTRATIQMMGPSGENMHPKAIHIRNAIALAVDDEAKTVWAGVAGQDELERGHPYEIVDPFTVRSGVADYGWPYCYENHRSTGAGHNCANQIVPRAALPAYITPIGAAYYPSAAKGAHAFPPEWRGGLYVGLHGSWHRPFVAPRVIFLPLKGEEPAIPVDWNDPAKQWKQLAGGFQNADGGRLGRPTGIAVGAQGDVYVGDDQNGVVYRVRYEGPRR